MITTEGLPALSLFVYNTKAGSINIEPAQPTIINYFLPEASRLEYIKRTNIFFSFYDAKLCIF